MTLARLARMSLTKKIPIIPISALPLPPREHILTQSLTPDPLIHSAQSIREVLTNNPSVQRRARLVDAAAHFSHVTPLNLPFPYRIEPPEDEDGETKSFHVERWLSEREPLDEQPPAPVPETNVNVGCLKKYSRDKRDIPRELIALSDSGLRDCFPQLAIGDAFVQIGAPSLSADEEVPVRSVSGAEVAVRQELVDVLTGHSVLMATGEGVEIPYAPWSLRYSGHQFGVWAGQLGDGRAMSILEASHPSNPDLIYELQLKGAGRTPYSRTADGLAVLRSSIREFLCSEAMHALHIPTTRALSLVHLPELHVIREEVETACVLARMAPSFLRIGSFEALNPPQDIFLFGGGQQAANYDALRILGEWVHRRVLRLNLAADAPWGKALVMDCARRNAQMVAGWQAYGFMHGVINTDNVSIMGLTIDYGPYAFMDIFEPMHICNHTDGEGRYAYKYQPTMIAYALRALLSSLSPLIGAETEFGAAVKAGWADGVSKEKIEGWTKKGAEVEEEMKAEIEAVMEKEYKTLFRKRLGLKTEEPTDANTLIRPLFNLLQSHKLDFHGTFRRLCFFRPTLLSSDSADGLTAFIANLAANSFEMSTDDVDATKDWCAWLAKYMERVEKEVEAGIWGESAGEDVWVEREKEMLRANPRFVLRQWVLEEIIKRVQDDVGTGKRALAKVHEMATNPYESWGAENDKRSDSELSDEEKEERRFCGLGAKTLLGFQCSCSS